MELSGKFYDLVCEKIEAKREVNGEVETEAAKELVGLIEIAFDNDEACDFLMGLFVTGIVGLMEVDDPEISKRAENVFTLMFDGIGIEGDELNEIKTELLEIAKSIKDF